jgi:DNA mismatch repair ATPase MutS
LPNPSCKPSKRSDAKVFAVITEKIDQQGVAFRDLARSIAAVDSLQAFIAVFKKQEIAETASN